MSKTPATIRFLSHVNHSGIVDFPLILKSCCHSAKVQINKARHLCVLSTHPVTELLLVQALPHTYSARKAIGGELIWPCGNLPTKQFLQNMRQTIPHDLAEIPHAEPTH